MFLIFYTLATTLGALFILQGLILLTRRKFMVRREYDRVLHAFFIILGPILLLNKMGHETRLLFIGVLPFIVFVIIVTRGRYTIYNVNTQMVSSALTDILEAKGMSYEEEKSFIIFKDYDNKRISYTQSLNSVEINLRDARKLRFYEELRTELRSGIKDINLTVFPATGLFFIVIGAILIVALQYL
ncbi:hypothetical protein Amet_1823 [Alkaliphilus metalliredigens QYMF]|uniref:Uncharacterized protein n=1 Tax=Alkaliphilus metalliredigens (strain QYMF) TaxID=293826 RepID=A6TP75_ALKMQ|nr:hypothetical protein [Alkaliphilus metalliredigens]ABR47993.1 hypothetical protein Amet_1823 [Alkaliphilus metalliredigens QYMF]